MWLHLNLFLMHLMVKLASTPKPRRPQVQSGGGNPKLCQRNNLHCFFCLAEDEV